MKRGLLILCAIIVGMLVVTSCGNREKNPNTVIEYLKALRSYTCDVNVHIKNDRQEIDIGSKQAFHKDFGYRLDINKERTLIYKENEVRVSDLGNNIDYTLDNKFDNVYKLSFIQYYIGLLYTDEEIQSTFKKIEERDYQLIGLTIPGNNRNISKAVLYIDIETKLPTKLCIYDIKDNEVISFTYTNFIPNADVKKEIFTKKETNE